MNNQKGFTLIELVVVIVILGILSAVAVPKFVNMQDDAKIAALEGARGAVKSAAALVHGKWLVGAQTSPVSVEGDTVVVNDKGYPTAAAAGIMIAAGLTEDFAMSTSDGKIARKEDVTIDSNNTTVNSGAKYFTYIIGSASPTDGIPTVGSIQ